MDEEYYNMKANPIEHSDKPLLVRPNGQRVWCCPSCMEKNKNKDELKTFTYYWRPHPIYQTDGPDNFAVIYAKSEEEAREKFEALNTKGTIISIQESIKEVQKNV